MTRTFPVVLIALIAISGCSTAPTIYQSSNAAAPPLEASVLILPADIEIAEVSVGGNNEVKADWSDSAKQGFNGAIEEFFFTRGIRPVPYGADTLTDQDLAIIRQANVNLHAIQLAQAGGQMAGVREYALSPELLRSLEGYEADYAVFVMMRARKASAGRTAVRILTRGPLSFEVLYGSYRAALFDLRDGQIVWANMDPQASSGLGNPANADTGRWLNSFETLFRKFPL